MKLYLEPVAVEHTGGRPHTILWRRKLYRVIEVLDCWVSQGKWWSSEERRVYMRLLTDGGTLELFRRGNEWRLSRLFD
jgi:hypothetical protein